MTKKLTQAELADLLRPGLEALPLAGHAWHEFIVRIKRNRDGSLGLHGFELYRMPKRPAPEPPPEYVCVLAPHQDRIVIDGFYYHVDAIKRALGPAF